jgi:FHA domain
VSRAATCLLSEDHPWEGSDAAPNRNERFAAKQLAATHGAWPVCAASPRWRARVPRGCEHVVLCPRCRRQMLRAAPSCANCGALRNGDQATLDLVLADRTRVPLSVEVTIGRAPGNTLRLSDPSVSRHHAQISPGARPDDPPLLRDLGSRYGTWLDGRRLDRAHVHRPIAGMEIRTGIGICLRVVPLSRLGAARVLQAPAPASAAGTAPPSAAGSEADNDTPTPATIRPRATTPSPHCRPRPHRRSVSCLLATPTGSRS